jgi:nucleotide-binding universal stress UspA family protein
MKTINTIMVAVDFSSHSIKAARYASGLAKDVDAKLLLVNVYNQRDVDMLNEVALRVPAFSVKKHIDEHIAERKSQLEDLAKEMGEGKLKIQTSISIGVPFEALLQEIDKKHPDLLVMGAKGRSNVVDMIVGSCAQKMFRRSPIPLLSIREDESILASSD